MGKVIKRACHMYSPLLGILVRHSLLLVGAVFPISLLSCVGFFCRCSLWPAVCIFVV